MSRSRVPGRISAPMAVTRQLRAAEKRATAAMMEHAKHCSTCHNAVSITGRYCDTGWPLARARARAIYNWNNRDRITAADNMPQTLF